MISAIGAAAAVSPAAASAAGFATPSASGKPTLVKDGDFTDNLYTRIGIRPIINCRGTFTIISGSCSLPEVKQAMYDASFYYVQMDEMMNAVGAELAKLTGAEWGICTTGAAAATCLATIACIAGTDIEKCEVLPFIKKKDQVLIPHTSRNPYDIGVRMSSTELVEFTTPEELRAKISDRTAMLYILAGPLSTSGPMSTKILAAIAKEKGIPVFVDAAAEEPNNPNIHLSAGADLVAYSGGKCMRGPQSAALLLGNKNLCKAAYYQAAPHHCYGRSLKCSKEETMGMLAAVRQWYKRDHAAEAAEWTTWMQYIADHLKGFPSLTADVTPPHEDLSNKCPGLRIRWDANKLGITGTEVAKKLNDGAPRIVINGTGARPDMMQSGLSISSYMLEPGHYKIVADVLSRHLQEPRPLREPCRANRRSRSHQRQVGRQHPIPTRRRRADLHTRAERQRRHRRTARRTLQRYIQRKHPRRSDPARQHLARPILAGPLQPSKERFRAITCRERSTWASTASSPGRQFAPDRNFFYA